MYLRLAGGRRVHHGPGPRRSSPSGDVAIDGLLAESAPGISTFPRPMLLTYRWSRAQRSDEHGRVSRALERTMEEVQQKVWPSPSFQTAVPIVRPGCGRDGRGDRGRQCRGCLASSPSGYWHRCDRARRRRGRPCATRPKRCAAWRMEGSPGSRRSTRPRPSSAAFPAIGINVQEPPISTPQFKLI